MGTLVHHLWYQRGTCPNNYLSRQVIEVAVNDCHPRQIIEIAVYNYRRQGTVIGMPFCVIYRWEGAPAVTIDKVTKNKGA